MAKSAKAKAWDAAYKARQKAQAARLKTFDGDRVAASIAHHKERLARAIQSKDSLGILDAQKVIADLERGRPSAP
jgi:hypothetical protein